MPVIPSRRRTSESITDWVRERLLDVDSLAKCGNDVGTLDPIGLTDRRPYQELPEEAVGATATRHVMGAEWTGDDDWRRRMPDARCESPWCIAGNGADQLGRHQLQRGMRLCSGCIDTLANHLSRLRELYWRSGAILHHRPQREIMSRQVRTSGGIVLDDAVVSFRAAAMSVLASWCGLVVQERSVSVAPRRQVAELADFLTVHLDWLAAHPAASDAAAEIQELTEKAESAVNPTPLTKLEVGRCDRPGCASNVHMIVGVRNWFPNRVCCDSGHVWRPHEWLVLAHRIEQARRTHEADGSDGRGTAA